MKAHILPPMRFRVPASTTNLGHGFDCFGIALSAANVCTYKTIDAPGDDALSHMLEDCRKACASAWETELPALSVSIEGDVPIARGMGSSSTIYASCIAAYQGLHGKDIDMGEIIRLGSELEGHPDNICAAVLGGFTIVGSVNEKLQWQRYPMNDLLEAVITIPSYEVKTNEARKVLPDHFSKEEGILAIQRCSMISAALVGGRLDILHGLFKGSWHEHYRARLNPALDICRKAADEAGAISTFISGSGSCILSLCTKSKVSGVKEALENAYTDEAEIRKITFNNNGLEQLS